MGGSCLREAGVPASRSRTEGRSHCGPKPCGRRVVRQKQVGGRGEVGRPVVRRRQAASNIPPADFKSPGLQYRVPGAVLGGDQKAPFAFVVHVATARNFLPCAGPVHPRLARSLRENCRRPRRPGRPSSPLRHQPRPPGCPFFELPQARYEGLYVGQALFFPGLQGLGRERQGNPSPHGRVPDIDFAGPSVPAWIGPAVPGLSIRTAGELAIWVANRERPRKLDRRDPARVPGDDDSGPLEHFTIDWMHIQRLRSNFDILAP